MKIEKHTKIITIIIISFIIFLFFLRKIRTYNNKNNKNNKILSYYKCDKYAINKATRDIFIKEKIFKISNPKEADIYLICEYNNVEKEYDNIPNNKYINAIKGCDKIVSKNNLWKLIKQYHGIEKTLTLVPCTYLLDSYDDKIKLLKNKGNNIYILKKNLQRQEGLKFITQKEINLNILNNFYKDKYVLAQEYLDNPLLINGRKVNMRIYLLIVIKNRKKYGYIYNDGFMYYTKKPYNYSTNIDEGITTGYIDREIYNTNPLTHIDLKNYLIKNNIDDNILFENIQCNISEILDAIHSSIYSTKGETNFQLFGIDIQPDSNLNVKLIEINKGPSLIEMDEKDAKIKRKLQEDIYKTVGIVKDNSNNNFTLIWKNNK